MTIHSGTVSSSSMPQIYQRAVELHTVCDCIPGERSPKADEISSELEMVVPSAEVAAATAA